jgi:dGTPase
MCLSEGQKYAKELEDRELRDLKPYALRSQERRDNVKHFREYKLAPLEYRTEYHRDRDRIVWSKTFKRMQHKTQIFPYYAEDHYRRRLTHSLEVAQIGATIARALRLNEVATEAIALGHDLGHTPFGHAGEATLNKILLDEGEKRKKKSSDTAIPIFGFDHCVHAIEVVTRIEQEYITENEYPGLNLTFDIRDGILKHMYSISPVDVKRPFSNISEVVKFGPYRDFGDNNGSLEAQCVYFSDSLAYLLSDTEDGIRCNVLQCKDLEKDKLIRNIWDKYNEIRNEHAKIKLENIDDFLFFRRKAITVLILNCINTSQKKIQDEGVKSVDDVLTRNKRMITIEDNLSKFWDSFYQKWMYGIFFNDTRVVSCSCKAEHIITQLFYAYLKKFELVPKYYRDVMRKFYAPYIDGCDDLLRLVSVRNYIAGMTDVFATNQHARLFMSSERVVI